MLTYKVVLTNLLWLRWSLPSKIKKMPVTKMGMVAGYRKKLSDRWPFNKAIHDR
jgi:hypothetical protein